MNFLKKAAAELREVVEDEVEKVERAVSKTNVKENDAKKQANAGMRDVEIDGVIMSDEEFAGKVKVCIPAEVKMISGCHDTQTSADVSSTASFELPANAGPGGAGGAATSSLMATVLNKGSIDMTWLQVLESMRGILLEKGYTQIPQLSSSRNLDVAHEKFSFVNADAQPGSKKKALLVGINYVGQRGELSGCHNDVLSMMTYLKSLGFDESSMKILMDDDSHEPPTGANILKGFDWLTENNSNGDSLFFHYSGHGGYVTDDSGDEKDGRDETLVPLDFKSAGQISDDLVFKELVLPVSEGVTLCCVMDCCHSGTVLDLPFEIKASSELDSSSSMHPNSNFSFKKLMEIAKKLYEMKNSGASNQEIAREAFAQAMPLIQGANKESGGLGNLMSMFSGSSTGSSSGMPSLPF